MSKKGKGMKMSLGDFQKSVPNDNDVALPTAPRFVIFLILFLIDYFIF